MQVQQVELECVQGDIARQVGMDAVVNAANAQLMPGGGVAGALHRAAGPGLAEECTPLAPIHPGQAVITSGHGLPNPYVIHVLGPVFGVDEPAEALLAACYRNGLRRAEASRLRSVAFPAISTGAFGYPLEPAIRVAVDTVLRAVPTLEHVRHVRFVLHDGATRDRFEQILAEMAARAGR